MHCKIKDLKVHCRVVGSGMPIVMVHGMGVDHRTMTGCIESVFQSRDDEWKRIYFDLPGMGNTKGVDWITNSDDMFRFVLAVVDEIIPGEPFLIVGESYGGYLVRAVVRERPEDVEGMLLICPLIVADDEQRDVPPCTVLERDSALDEKLEPEEKQFLDLFLVNQSEEKWERFRDEMLAGFKGGDEAFKARIRGDIESYAFTFDVDDLAAPFEKPSLIVAGRQDCLVGYQDAWKLVENYPRSSFAVLDGAGHGLQIEQAGLFNALANEWLDRVKEESTA
ncbi:MAG: alpha/beta hydrolase [Chloroflexi bacterium]|nr:alpha/beta hydrolase [Chloroflexota bacterium]